MNAWTKGLLLYNIKNTIGLTANILETVSDLWKSLIDLYDQLLEVVKLYTKEQLKSLHLYNGNNFPNHIAHLRPLQ